MFVSHINNNVKTLNTYTYIQVPFGGGRAPSTGTTAVKTTIKIAAIHDPKRAAIRPISPLLSTPILKHTQNIFALVLYYLTGYWNWDWRWLQMLNMQTYADFKITPSLYIVSACFINWNVNIYPFFGFILFTPWWNI